MNPSRRTGRSTSQKSAPSIARLSTVVVAIPATSHGRDCHAADTLSMIPARPGAFAASSAPFTTHATIATPIAKPTTWIAMLRGVIVRRAMSRSWPSVIGGAPYPGARRARSRAITHSARTPSVQRIFFPSAKPRGS